MLAIPWSNHTEAFNQPEWMPIYDGRAEALDRKLSKADIDLVRQQALPRAKNVLAEGSDFNVEGMAQGAFTRKGAAQKAFLYRYRSTGHNFATNGIAVFEDGKLVA